MITHIVHFGVMVTVKGVTGDPVNRFESLCGLTNGANVTMDLDDYIEQGASKSDNCARCDLLISVAETNGISLRHTGQRKRIERFLRKVEWRAAVESKRTTLSFKRWEKEQAWDQYVDACLSQ